MEDKTALLRIRVASAWDMSPTTEGLSDNKSLLTRPLPGQPEADLPRMGVGEAARDRRSAGRAWGLSQGHRPVLLPRAMGCLRATSWCFRKGEVPTLWTRVGMPGGRASHSQSVASATSSLGS